MQAAMSIRILEIESTLDAKKTLKPQTWVTTPRPLLGQLPQQDNYQALIKTAAGCMLLTAKRAGN